MARDEKTSLPSVPSSWPSSLMYYLWVHLAGFICYFCPFEGNLLEHESMLTAIRKEIVVHVPFPSVAEPNPTQSSILHSLLKSL